MVLVDTSAWIAVFARPQRLRLDDIVDLDDVVTALPIVQEVLQGFRDERAFSVARESMLSLPILESPIGAGVFVEAAQLYRAGRRAGATIRSGAACLIAACALRHGAVVMHRDRDYDALARVSALSVRRV